MLITVPGVQPAGATLSLLQPDASVPATFVGRGGVSTDGVGTTSGQPATLQAEVPAGSTVVQAYLYATYIFGVDAPTEAQRTIGFEGAPVVLALRGPDASTPLATARATVTSAVAAKVGSGGGITNFNVLEDAGITGVVDGTALVVIYSNPSLPVTTIAVLDGESSQSGDAFTFAFATPLEPDRPGFSATLALGIGFSYQGAAGNACGGNQFSTVDVNGARLTSCAGNYDDGVGEDGALITVGGVGDATDNPADPDATSGGTDDELYNLVPFLTEGDADITVETANPSSDDNLFLAVLSITQESGPPVAIPEAVDDESATAEGTPVDIDVIANDDDPDGVLDPATLSIASPPSDGTATVANGLVTYTPAAGFTGVDTFDYTICGVDFTVCSDATVTVTVTADGPRTPVPAPAARPAAGSPTYTG